MKTNARTQVSCSTTRAEAVPDTTLSRKNARRSSVRGTVSPVSQELQPPSGDNPRAANSGSPLSPQRSPAQRADGGSTSDVVTIARAAQVIGFPSALSCKRFCLRHKVRVFRHGKHRFVSLSEIEAFITHERALPANSVVTGGDASAAARAALGVEAMMRKAGR